ncbi:MAG: hypothetical protein NTW19_02570 [Planctomycetota bacterium]|nr:hypothetical protein [Planctomycetota bacterium]
MATARQDFTMHQGTHRTLRVSLAGTVPTTAGAAVWRVARDRASTALLSKTLAEGGVGNLTTGTLDISLFPSDTATLDAGEYYHELRVTDADGQQDVVLEGTLTLKASITA